ncbi:MAG TPA: methyltransferase [Xanthomonadaceae bacterium]|nr:methyltransferase [Xanthomonadaceae bacterium]
MNRTLPVLAATLFATFAMAACSADQAPDARVDAADGSAPPAAGAGGAGDDADRATGTRAEIDAAVAGSWRDPSNVERDPHRHPAETLAFFGIEADDTVVEITPGGGWYAEILAPLLRDDGHYVAAVWDDAIPDQPAYRYRLNDELRAKFAAAPEAYGTPDVRLFDPAQPSFGPAGSADVVLTFRNAHNWVADGNAEAYFDAFFDVLAPGGTLGVVDHRAKPGTSPEAMASSGYLTEDLVVRLATDAGFVLEARSEVNANPRDTADHPNGVWTLPPSNNHDDADDAKYQAIGESDRMTLRFRKPRQ